MNEVLPDVTTLWIVRAIGITGSFRQAAIAAGLSQQAASARVAATETLLGFSLVERVCVSVSWPRHDGRSWPHLQRAGVLVTV